MPHVISLTARLLIFLPIKFMDGLEHGLKSYFGNNMMRYGDECWSFTLKLIQLIYYGLLLRLNAQIGQTISKKRVKLRV